MHETWFFHDFVYFEISQHIFMLCMRMLNIVLHVFHVFQMHLIADYGFYANMKICYLKVKIELG
jgi:hypothetical protein